MKFPTAQDRAALGLFLQGQKGVQGVADASEGRASSMASMIHGVVVPQSKKAI